MTIISTLPYSLTNGSTADATQVMADFNQIVNNVNANAAANGANSDITSLSGLSTPLSVTQGGTGTTTSTGTGSVVLSASPALTGSPTAPTQTALDSSTKVATTAYADASSAAQWTTGDVKLTIKTVADTGWVLMNDGTIGDAASGATTRANADTSALFTLLWNNTSNTDCPVSGGRGASAAADFAANKTIALPKALGRALAVYGSGSGLTARTMGESVGEETHLLTSAESGLQAHSVSVSGNVTDGAGNVFNTADSGGGTSINRNWLTGPVNNDIPAAAGHDWLVSISGSVAGASAASAHDNMQPSVFLNVMIKL